MTKAELLGGLSGAAIAALGYFTARALFSRWGMPGFLFLLVLVLGFAGGLFAARARASRRDRP
jgi:hypothetical protein